MLPPKTCVKHSSEVEWILFPHAFRKTSFPLPSYISENRPPKFPVLKLPLAISTEAIQASVPKCQLPLGVPSRNHLNVLYLSGSQCALPLQLTTYTLCSPYSINLQTFPSSVFPLEVAPVSRSYQYVC